MSRLWFFQDNNGNERGPIGNKELDAVLLLGDRYIREDWDKEWHMASEYFAELDINLKHSKGESALTKISDEVKDLIPTISEEPYDHPPPPLTFKNKIFVFTGDFAFGDRDACQLEVQKRGGICDKRVTRDTDYLVIGKYGSEYWVASKYGTKIKTAIKYKLAGSTIAIISEEYWVASL